MSAILWFEPVGKVLQSAATSAGNGNEVMLNGKYGAITLQISGTFSATITFEGSIDGINYIPVRGINKNTGAGISTVAETGIFQFSVTGLNKFRARISAYTLGSITIEAIIVPVSEPALPVVSTGTTISASQTRPNDTTAYAALDVVGQDPAANITFANVLPNAGGAFVALGVRLRIDVAAIPAGMAGFRLHLYNAAPTAIADNAAYNLPAADRAKYLGYVEISNIQDIGDTLWAQAAGVNFMAKLAAGSTSLFGILETTGAYTPSALTVKTIMLNILAV